MSRDRKESRPASFFENWPDIGLVGSLQLAMAEKIKPFEIERRPIADDWLEIQIDGELDLATTDLLREWLEEPLTENANLSLNLQACEFIDCAGIAEILRARQRMEEAGQVLYVSGISPAARRLFDLTGLLATDLIQEPAKAV